MLERRLISFANAVALSDARFSLQIALKHDQAGNVFLRRVSSAPGSGPLAVPKSARRDSSSADAYSATASIAEFPSTRRVLEM